MGMLLNLFGGSKLKLIAIGILVAVLAGLALTIKIQAGKIDGLTAQVAAEQSAHATTKASFSVYREEAEAQADRTQRAMTDLAQSRYDAQTEINELSKKLARHDLGHLMRKKPGLIERRVNRATEKLFRDITWNPEDEHWSATDEAVYWIWVIDSGLFDVGWLLYAADRQADGNCRATDGPGLSQAHQARAYSAAVHGVGRGAPGHMPGGYRGKPRAGMPKSEAVRGSRAGVLSDHRIPARA